MSRTKHHRDQKRHPHQCGWSCGGKYKYNRHYGAFYGVDARNAADRERRKQDKSESLSGVDDHNITWGDEDECSSVDWLDVWCNDDSIGLTQ